MEKFKETVLSFLKQKWWYLFLLILSSLYVFCNRSNIYQLKDINSKNLIFLIWIILLIFPLFSEMELFGIKIKKEVEKAKSEVKENLNELRLQILDLKISNSNANTINIGNGVLPTEEKLKDLIKDYTTSSKTIVKINTTEKTDKSAKEEELGDAIIEVSDEIMYLFKARLTLEKTLMNLCEKTGFIGQRPIHMMVKHLIRCETINNIMAELIEQIVQITNRGIHGEIVSNEYIDFIKKVLPRLLTELNMINSQFQFNICPKCKYQGYSRYENYCPKCGFTNDDF